jgi:hypothetical protein
MNKLERMLDKMVLDKSAVPGMRYWLRQQQRERRE